MQTTKARYSQVKDTRSFLVVRGSFRKGVELCGEPEEAFDLTENMAKNVFRSHSDGAGIKEIVAIAEVSGDDVYLRAWHGEMNIEELPNTKNNIAELVKRYKIQNQD